MRLTNEAKSTIARHSIQWGPVIATLGLAVTVLLSLRAFANLPEDTAHLQAQIKDIQAENTRQWENTTRLQEQVKINQEQVKFLQTENKQQWESIIALQRDQNNEISDLRERAVRMETLLIKIERQQP